MHCVCSSCQWCWYKLFASDQIMFYIVHVSLNTYTLFIKVSELFIIKITNQGGSLNKLIEISTWKGDHSFNEAGA